MASEHVTLIVTCTDRKASEPPGDLRIRSLPQDSLPSKAALWMSRLSARVPQFSLRDLYMGEAWAQALRLERALRRHDYDVSTWVVSAGLGLVPLDFSSSPYAATFARRHLDSVANSQHEAAVWWWHICQLQGWHLRDVLNGRCLMVLSDSYAVAVEEEMELAMTSVDPPELLLFGGRSTSPATRRVPSQKNLRTALGGTAMSLNLRMATQWVMLDDNHEFVSQEQVARWDTWAQQNAREEVYARTQLTDDEVRSYVMRTKPQGDSRTRALRQLRDKGFACEQSRFSRIFDEVEISSGPS